MASQPPSASTPTMPSDGIAVSAGLYRAVSRIIRSRDPNSFALAASSCSCSCSSWPKPLTTRTPPMASSTMPTTSPDCCCASQLAGNSLRREASAMNHSAGATATVTSVSTGDRITMMTGDDDEQDDVAERDRHHGQQALHHVQVGDGPADQLPGADLVLARAVQPGQRAEQLGPQVVLDVEGHPAAMVTAQVDAGEVDRGRDQQQPGQRPDRLPGASTMTLSMMLPLHQRDRGRRHRGRAARPPTRHADVAAITPAVARQPSQPPVLGSRVPAVSPVLLDSAYPVIRADKPTTRGDSFP